MIECPNCGSEQHYAWFSERVRYSGALTGAADDPFKFGGGVIDPMSPRRGGGTLIQYRCAGCDQVLVPFQVDGEVHVRALDEKDADNPRLQSDEELDAAMGAGWQAYRDVTGRLERVGLEQIRRTVLAEVPDADTVVLSDDGEGWRLDHVTKAKQAMPEATGALMENYDLAVLVSDVGSFFAVDRFELDLRKPK